MGHDAPGGMDISEQKRTFAGFIKGTIWLAAIVAAILIFLALFAV